jgi:hypothetical protein
VAYSPESTRLNLLRYGVTFIHRAVLAGSTMFKGTGRTGFKKNEVAVTAPVDRPG